MAFVLDASVAAVWFLRDEISAVAEQALERLDSDSATVPALWWFEVRNLLIIAERRGRIARPETSEALSKLAVLMIGTDAVPDSDMVMHLARHHRLSVYDAAYLELAMRRVLPLASLDKSLSAAAKAEGISLIGISD